MKELFMYMYGINKFESFPHERSNGRKKKLF